MKCACVVQTIKIKNHLPRLHRKENNVMTNNQQRKVEKRKKRKKEKIGECSIMENCIQRSQREI